MPDLSSMRLTFSDEFDTRSISQDGRTTRWSDIRNEWRMDANSDIGFGHSSFVDPSSGYDPFNVSNGVLTITAVPDRTPSGYPGSWESGIITTQNSFSQQYGYFEIRADFSNRTGAWDAFWLLPTKQPANPNNLPGWSELDIVEHYGVNDRGIYTHIHTTDPEPNKNWQRDLQFYSELANPDGFHTYGMMWTADTLSMYIDGQLMGTKATPSDMHQPMYILANLATQDDANPANGAMSMKIDYIRAYALPGAIQNPPTITFGGGGASATISTPENRLAVATMTAADANGDVLAFSLAGGADAGLFTINASTGALTFKGSPDFENLADANRDAIYNVTVRVSDGQLSTTQALRVVLSNVVETQARSLTSGTDQFTAPSDDHWIVSAGLGNDSVTTRNGNDTLDGGAGADTLSGGMGNDIYFVDSLGDLVIEGPQRGVDEVRTTLATYILAAGVENLTGMLANGQTLTGNGLANTMVGASGNDTLFGLVGNDTLSAGNGNDALQGGVGADVLSGGAGRDIFTFNTALGGGNVDRILDFSSVDDTIVLDDAIFTAVGRAGTLSASAFFAGTAARDTTDRVIYDGKTGNIFYDADGTGASPMTLFGQVAIGTQIAAGDFYIL